VVSGVFCRMRGEAEAAVEAAPARAGQNHFRPSTSAMV
jgi:hypothetical protein